MRRGGVAVAQTKIENPVPAFEVPDTDVFDAGHAVERPSGNAERFCGFARTWAHP